MVADEHLVQREKGKVFGLSHDLFDLRHERNDHGPFVELVGFFDGRIDVHDIFLGCLRYLGQSNVEHLLIERRLVLVVEIPFDHRHEVVSSGQRMNRHKEYPLLAPHKKPMWCLVFTVGTLLERHPIRHVYPLVSWL